MFLLSDLDPRVRTLGYMVKLFAKVERLLLFNFPKYCHLYFFKGRTTLAFRLTQILSFAFQVCDIGDASRGSFVRLQPHDDLLLASKHIDHIQSMI